MNSQQIRKQPSQLAENQKPPKVSWKEHTSGGMANLSQPTGNVC